MTITTTAAANVAWNQLVDAKGNYHSPNGDKWANHNSRTDSFRDPISDLYHWEDDDEKRQGKASVEGLVQRLKDGWNATHGVVTVERVTDDAYRQHLAEMRSKQAIVWLASDEPVIQEVGKTACQMWCLTSEGELTPQAVNMIEFVANMAYRRGFSIPAAVTVNTYGVAADDVVYDYDIPIEVKEFATEGERFENHFSENFKEGGRVGYSPFELYDIALKWVRMGGIEADLVRKGMKRGTAQKLYLLATLDNKYKTLNVAKRIRMEAPKGKLTLDNYKAGGYIPLSKVKPQELRPVKTAVMAGQAKMSDVEAYIASLFAPSTNANAPKIMTKERMTAVSESHACDLVRIVINMVLNDDATVREKLANSADLLNDATELILEELELLSPLEEEPTPELEETPVV